ncbi:MAG: hypothetical protein ACTSPV_17690, partial [Candidatus Hodarchaeales archaeon]
RRPSRRILFLPRFFNGCLTSGGLGKCFECRLHLSLAPGFSNFRITAKTPLSIKKRRFREKIEAYRD